MAVWQEEIWYIDSIGRLTAQLEVDVVAKLKANRGREQAPLHHKGFDIDVQTRRRLRMAEFTISSEFETLRKRKEELLHEHGAKVLKLVGDDGLDLLPLSENSLEAVAVARLVKSTMGGDTGVGAEQAADLRGSGSHPSQDVGSQPSQVGSQPSHGVGAPFRRLEPNYFRLMVGLKLIEPIHAFKGRKPATTVSEAMRPPGMIEPHWGHWWMDLAGFQA